MENDLQNLLFNSNYEFNSFYGNSHSDALIAEKAAIKQTLPTADLNETGYFLSQLQNEVFTHTNETTYSLNDLVTGSNLLDSPLDMPVGSPATSLSSDDMSVGALDEFFTICPQEVLQSELSPYSSISSPLSVESTEELSNGLSIASPQSVSSNYSSSEDESMDGNHLLQQFFASLESSAAAAVDSTTSTDNATQLLQPQTEGIVLNATVVEEPVAAEQSKAGKIKKPRKPRTAEQKSRKQAQNRKAASRYRDKKKYELTDIFTGVKELEQQNTTLKDKVCGLTKEIDYLKTLMLDVIKARLTNAQSPQSQLSLETISQTLLSCGN